VIHSPHEITAFVFNRRRTTRNSYFEPGLRRMQTGLAIEGPEIRILKIAYLRFTGQNSGDAPRKTWNQPQRPSFGAL